MNSDKSTAQTVFAQSTDDCAAQSETAIVTAACSRHACGRLETAALLRSGQPLVWADRPNTDEYGHVWLAKDCPEMPPLTLTQSTRDTLADEIATYEEEEPWPAWTQR